ncbi:hypothetical protein [Streptomyces sp. cmx-18-6]|uniref:hypothetical protein n=1 Tax=Streptomyces sp. cmx-18-6 TaxID=2790930 RepID=UPI003980F3FC
MPAVIVEIHVPLLPTPDLPDGAYAFPWIGDVEDFLADLEDEGVVEVHDEGEEHGDAYVFLLTLAGDGDGTGVGAGVEELLAAASRVAAREGVPAGAFAVVSDDGAEEFGLGRRIALPLPEGHEEEKR